MKWDVEMEEIEAVLDKISDLHDKLSDAIHSISRTHFLNSTKSFKNNNNSADHNNFRSNECHLFDHGFKTNNENVNGFVFFKDSAIAEAKSLNSIRSALEHLEQQLGFLDVSFSLHAYKLFFCSFIIIAICSKYKRFFFFLKI